MELITIAQIVYIEVSGLGKTLNYQIHQIHQTIPRCSI